MLLLVMPGPVMVYIAARGFEQGRRGALTAVLGIQAAELVHIVVGAIGLGALIASSATVLTGIAFAGAMYRLGLGVHTLVPRRTMVDPATSPQPFRRATFRHSVMINLLNPHTMLFYLAFLPGFVDPALGSVTVQFLSYGLIFVVLGLVVEGGFALLAGSIRSRIADSARSARICRLVVGGGYIVFGVALAVNGWT